MRAPTPGNPRLDFVKSGDVDVRHLRLCGRFVHYSGVVAELNRKDWAVGRGFSKYPPLRRATYDLAQPRLHILAGLLVWRFLKMGGPAMGQQARRPTCARYMAFATSMAMLRAQACLKTGSTKPNGAHGFCSRLPVGAILDGAHNSKPGKITC
jgi:hypothetical protein